jgi:HlyD family secretion protein
MKRVVVVAAIALGAIVGGLLLWRVFAPRPADAVVLSGYVEGEALYLAPPISGTVTTVAVVRGQRVVVGAPVFSIDARTLLAERAQARAQLDQARQQLAAAKAVERQQAASLAAAEAQANNAVRDAARYADTSGGAVSVQEVDRAQTAARNTRAERDAAAQTVRAAAAQVAAAAATVAHAKAFGAEAQVRLDQLSVRAPASGRIEEVFYQAGEWAAANQPIVSLIPDGKVKLRFYVPEARMALYRPGRRVRFDCDACGGARSAVISYVSPRPEYTPPVIYSLKSRDRMVFLVEALPADGRTLTPGLPVDVVPLTADKVAGR